ncbi:MAG: tetratricopeptide repeat protein [Planctomycetes bacterium]|nr:tetratricopeptide repeat protein [Planctomycetota bacterium]
MSWQPLARRCAIGEPIAMRLFIENLDGRPVEGELRVELGEGWELVGAPTPELQPRLAPRSTRETLFAFVPTEPGSRRLPSLRLTIGTHERTLQPVPAMIDVDAVPRIRLIGRDRELERVERWLARHASGTMALVRGRAGSGRSELLDRAVGLATRAGLRVVRATGHGGPGEALEMSIDLLRSVLGLFEPLRDRDARVDFARARLCEVLGESAPSQQYFIDLLRGADPVDVDASVEQLRWYRLLSASATFRPTLLVIDDLDRADEPSIALVEGVLRRARSDGLPIFALGSTRDANDATDPSVKIDADRIAESIPLGPLSEADVDLWIAERFPGSNVRDYWPGLAAALIERSGGWPGAIHETLVSLSRVDEREALFRPCGARWEVDANVDIEARLASIPIGYDALIEERLQGISASSGPIVELAALLGPEFEVELLARWFDSEDEIDDALDDLERARVIEPLDADLSRYRFTHPALVRYVVARIEAAGSRRAARLRRRVAATLLEAHDPSAATGRSAEELGLRLIELGKADAALPYLLEALRRRVKRRQAADAQRVARRIAELESRHPIGGPSERYEWLSLQGRAMTMTGQLDSAERVTLEARQIAERAGDRPGMLLCTVLLSEIAIRRGRFAVGRDLALAAREEATGRFEPIHIDAGRNLAIAYRRLGDRERAAQIWSEDLERAIADNDLSGEIRCQNNLGILDYESRDFDSASRRFRRAVDIARDLDHLDYEMTARVWIANIAFERGRLEEARDGYREAIPAFQLLQNRRALSRSYFNRAQVELFRGEGDAALADYERAVALCAEMGDLATEAQYRTDLALVRFELGDLDGAGAEWLACDEAIRRLSAPSAALRSRLALLAERLGDRGPLESLANDADVADDGDASRASASPARMLRIAVRLRHDPRPHDVEQARAVIGLSDVWGEIRDRLLLATALACATSETLEEVRRRVVGEGGGEEFGPWLETALPRWLA